MEGPDVNQAIRVVIADDHRLMLDGLTQALDSLPDITVVGTVVDGAELADEVRIKQPDVLLVDVEMPHISGLSAISKIRDLPPTLIVTMHAADDYGTTAREAGARGFLSKGLPLPDLAAAIRAVNDGVDLFEAEDTTLDDYKSPTLSTRAETITDRKRMCSAVSCGASLARRTSQTSCTSHRRL